MVVEATHACCNNTMEDIENRVINLANNPRCLQVNLQVKLANYQ